MVCAIQIWALAFVESWSLMLMLVKSVNTKAAQEKMVLVTAMVFALLKQARVSAFLTGLVPTAQSPDAHLTAVVKELA